MRARLSKRKGQRNRLYEKEERSEIGTKKGTYFSFGRTLRVNSLRGRTQLVNPGASSIVLARRTHFTLFIRILSSFRDSADFLVKINVEVSEKEYLRRQKVDIKDRGHSFRITTILQKYTKELQAVSKNKIEFGRCPARLKKK